MFFVIPTEVEGSQKHTSVLRRLLHYGWSDGFLYWEGCFDSSLLIGFVLNRQGAETRSCMFFRHPDRSGGISEAYTCTQETPPLRSE